MGQNTAVLVIGFQADFTEFHRGAMPLTGTGKDYIDQVIKETKTYHKEGYYIIAVMDSHPKNHVSFCHPHSDIKPHERLQVNGRRKLWPPHCIEGTPGAKVLLPYSIPYTEIFKGVDQNRDSNSGFFDEAGLSNGLLETLQILDVDRLIAYGLATDYAVHATVIHALRMGYKVDLRADLCRGISAKTEKTAVREMEWEGAEILTGITPLPYYYYNPASFLSQLFWH